VLRKAGDKSGDYPPSMLELVELEGASPSMSKLVELESESPFLLQFDNPGG